MLTKLIAKEGLFIYCYFKRSAISPITSQNVAIYFILSLSCSFPEFNQLGLPESELSRLFGPTYFLSKSDYVSGIINT